MPKQKSIRLPKGFEVLEVLQPVAPSPQPREAVSNDADVDRVLGELEERAGGRWALHLKLASAARAALDKSYDGVSTGRFHLAQLSKTEKAYTGSLLEVALQRALGLADGQSTDYQVLGFDVDCKYSHGSSWMIGPEIVGNIALLVNADDYAGLWSAWLVWVTAERLNAGTNRDAKVGLNAAGRAARIPIAQGASLPPNVLLTRPADAVAVMSLRSGQSRIDELCRRFEGTLLTRTTIETVARQLDPTKRMRENGGARSRLAAEGFLIIGAEDYYEPVVAGLGLPRPSKGQFLPLRVSPCTESAHGPRFRDRSGNWWRRAATDEPPHGLPFLRT